MSPARQTRSWLYLSSLVAMTLALVAASLATGPVALAHDEGKGPQAPLPANAAARAKEVRRANQQGVEALQVPSIVGNPAPCVDGVAAGYPCNNVDLESFLALLDMGAAPNERTNDVWGWTDPVSGREFAIVGMTYGTAFVEVTDPQLPVYVGDLHTHGALGSNWRDIKTHANHAFIVSEASGHGMQVFDLTQLLSVPNAPVTFDETAHYNGFGSAHNIVINDDTGFAYAVGASGNGACGGGLHMVDISAPTTPQFVGCFSDDGYTHDAQCVIYNGPDVAHVGREICLNSNEDTLTIVDVTDKGNPVQLSRTTYGDQGYVHQGWLTEDHVHFLLDDEFDEVEGAPGTRTRIFDVSDLDAPVVIGSHDAANTAIDHNQYVVGGHVFQANYRAGLRILGLTGVAAADLDQVGSFDIWPDNDATAFGGAWSTYPFFDSGTVLISGIELGLFVVTPDLNAPVIDNPPITEVATPEVAAMVGGQVSLEAFAGDDFGVSSVDFFIDGVLVGTDNDGSDGWSITWDSSTTSPGPATLTVAASDGSAQTDLDSHAINVIGMGDVDCNGVLTIVDALMIAQFAVGSRSDGPCPLPNPATEIYASPGDVNGDGLANVADALVIAQCTVGIVSPFCP